MEKHGYVSKDSENLYLSDNQQTKNEWGYELETSEFLTLSLFYIASKDTLFYAAKIINPL